jgi:hypothetical protein
MTAGNTGNCPLLQKQAVKDARRAARKPDNDKEIRVSKIHKNIFMIAENIFAGKLFDDVDSVDLLRSR